MFENGQKLRLLPALLRLLNLSLSMIISRANRKMKGKTFFRKIVNLYINCLKHAYYKTVKKCKCAVTIKNKPVE